MKKRAMKKWIPKDTCYCYGSLKKVKGGFKYIGHCKWRVRKKHKPDEYGIEEEWFCKYLGKFDEGLLWDACKECGEHYDGDKYYNRYYKWRYRNRKKIEKRGW